MKITHIRGRNLVGIIEAEHDRRERIRLYFDGDTARVFTQLDYKYLELYSPDAEIRSHAYWIGRDYYRHRG